MSDDIVFEIELGRGSRPRGGLDSILEHVLAEPDFDPAVPQVKKWSKFRYWLSDGTRSIFSLGKNDEVLEGKYLWIAETLGERPPPGGDNALVDVRNRSATVELASGHMFRLTPGRVTLLV